MSMTQNARRTRALAVLVAAAGLAHLPVTPEHLREAPYVGISFALFAAAAVVLATCLWMRPRSGVGVVVAGALSAAALVTYVATRLVAFPQIADDVGNWLEPWGVICVALELAAVVVAVVSRRAGAAAWQPVPAVPAADSAAPRRVAA
jgi:hypothetical protein